MTALIFIAGAICGAAALVAVVVIAAANHAPEPSEFEFWGGDHADRS